MAGFGDNTHVYQRVMTIPGGGRMELGEYTAASDNTLRIPTTLNTVMWGIALADGTKWAWADVTAAADGYPCCSKGWVDFCHSANAANGVVWRYMIFGY